MFIKNKEKFEGFKKEEKFQEKIEPSELDLEEEEDKEEALLDKDKKTFKNFEAYYKPSGFDFKVGVRKEEKNNLSEKLKKEN